MSVVNEVHSQLRRFVPVVAGAVSFSLLFLAPGTVPGVAVAPGAAVTAAAPQIATAMGTDAAESPTRGAPDPLGGDTGGTGGGAPLFDPTTESPGTDLAAGQALPPPSTPGSGGQGPVVATGATASARDRFCGRGAGGRVRVPENADLPGFASPYLGHTGSWDGAGGQADGSPKDADLDAEVAAGLRWTFMPVYWSTMEPNGPTSPREDPNGRWAALDSFVERARKRGLNILMQAPVVGGNAGAPPAWAGQRQAGSSAPENMDALVDFAGKLVERYRPCGTLAKEKGWTDGFGVRAWEFDNEPHNYGTNWNEVPDDYAEAFTKVATRINALDRRALVLAPALAHPSSEGAQSFLAAILDKGIQGASAAHRAQNKRYAIGPLVDVASFHTYEFNEGLFEGPDFEASQIHHQVRFIRAGFAKYQGQKGFRYPPQREYWHTEGGYDFAVHEPVGGGRKENWVIQFLARGFAAGVSRIVLQDLHQYPDGIVSVKTMSTLLPDPHPMRDVTRATGYEHTTASVYRTRRPDGGWTYVAWAANGSPGTTVELPVRGAAEIVSRTGERTAAKVTGGKAVVELPAGSFFSEPVFLVEGRRR